MGKLSFDREATNARAVPVLSLPLIFVLSALAPT